MVGSERGTGKNDSTKRPAGRKGKIRTMRLLQRESAAFKNNSAVLQRIRKFRLASSRWTVSVSETSVGFTPSQPAYGLMILVAIFSVIVLLMCWLCYSGDCSS